MLIADEPTTALDVTIQAQVLEVFERIQDRTKSSIVLITHDLGVVAGTADRVLVMYAGRAGRDRPTSTSSSTTRGIPTRAACWRRCPASTAPGSRGCNRIKGQPPSLIAVPPGCAFHPGATTPSCRRRAQPNARAARASSRGIAPPATSPSDLPPLSTTDLAAGSDAEDEGTVVRSAP